MKQIQKDKTPVDFVIAFLKPMHGKDASDLSKWLLTLFDCGNYSVLVYNYIQQSYKKVTADMFD